MLMMSSETACLTPEQRAQAAWDAWCASPEWRPDSNGPAAVALFATAIRDAVEAERAAWRWIVTAHFCYERGGALRCWVHGEDCNLDGVLNTSSTHPRAGAAAEQRP